MPSTARPSSEFYERLDAAAQHEADAPASTLLDPACRWNALINAMSTYISGAELDRISMQGSGPVRPHRAQLARRRRLWHVDQRLRRGFAGHARLSGHGIDHRGKRLRIETGNGAIAADQVIVTVPSAVLAAERIRFSPGAAGKDRGCARIAARALTTNSSCRSTVPKNSTKASGCSDTPIAWRRPAITCGRSAGR